MPLKRRGCDGCFAHVLPSGRWIASGETVLDSRVLKLVYVLFYCGRVALFGPDRVTDYRQRDAKHEISKLHPSVLCVSHVVSPFPWMRLRQEMLQELSFFLS